MILAADDHFMLHEQVGRRLRVETLLPALAEPSAQELGGMLFWVAIAVPAATALAIAYRAGSPAARRGARQLSLLIAPLVALGAGHVLLSALHPSFFETPGGQLFSVGRTGVKLLTTSVLLLQATSISITAWQPARND
ncbi:hypothetical protein MRU69_05740 [Kocuria flava]|uniref:hypothetical protein n=1 Tax=Kocuria flava TaxID=446860 RepID=UPI001FF1DB50|nr:hypothetical protein [Kocuria flava]MCJ8504303.1 hypothetical protein [Kocuria flava]MCJ8504370.1 hypothetical protein [Kocuria flava]